MQGKSRPNGLNGWVGGSKRRARDGRSHRGRVKKKRHRYADITACKGNEKFQHKRTPTAFLMVQGLYYLWPRGNAAAIFRTSKNK